MISVAGSALSAVLATDRQTVMLQGFWTLVAAAVIVSIGAWILLVREIRVQRRGRDDAQGEDATGDEVGAEGQVGAEDQVATQESVGTTVRDGDGEAPATHAVEVPADTADVGDPGDHP
jgi:hypothetical protein